MADESSTGDYAGRMAIADYIEGFRAGGDPITARWIIDQATRHGDWQFIADVITVIHGDGTAMRPEWDEVELARYASRQLVRGSDAERVHVAAGAVLMGSGIEGSECLAKHLVKEYPPELLGVMFAGQADQHDRAVVLEALLQEMIIQGLQPHLDANVRVWLTNGRDPSAAAVLPPYAVSFEYGFEGSEPVDRSGGVGVFIANALRVRGAARTTPFRIVSVRLHDQRATAPFKWLRAEAARITTDRPLADSEVLSALIAAEVGALRGADSEDDVSLVKINAHLAWCALYDAATDGGAYPPRHGPAIGRTSALDAMRGLLRLDPSTAPELVAASAAVCTWFTFEADTEWYEGDGWDVGLVCLSSDRTELGVVAATDTD